jgi:hypothetical protein
LSAICIIEPCCPHFEITDPKLEKNRPASCFAETSCWRSNVAVYIPLEDTHAPVLKKKDDSLGKL